MKFRILEGLARGGDTDLPGRSKDVNDITETFNGHYAFVKVYYFAGAAGPYTCSNFALPTCGENITFIVNYAEM